MPDPIKPPDELAEEFQSVLDAMPTRTRGRISFDIAADGAMFVSNELLVRGDLAKQRLQDIEPHAELADLPRRWHRATGVNNVINTLNIMLEEGHVAQPNHVFSASGGFGDCDCACPPHPNVATRIQLEGLAGLLGGNPLRSQPFRSQPFRSQPLRSQPFRSQPFRSQSQSPMSTARPAPGQVIPTREFGVGKRARPLVIVVDTGIAAQLPPFLEPGALGGPDDPVVFGQTDVPDQDGDGYLDPVAGHGTFIAGLIQQLAPGCIQLHVGLIDNVGMIKEDDVGALLELIPAVVGAIDRDAIVSMSFGGATFEKPLFLEDVTAAAAAATGTDVNGQPTGVALVSAAGNDGTCIPYFPAAWPTVVGVGGVGPDGPPEWTNYGEWVDACAPATDLVSSFFDFNGELPSINGIDEDDFDWWAYWSGTSFAAPCVVAALARSIAIDGQTAPAAIERVVRAPHLARIANLGTVVNV